MRVGPLSKLLFEFFSKLFFQGGVGQSCGVDDFLPRSVEDVFGRGRLLMHDLSFYCKICAPFFG